MCLDCLKDRAPRGGNREGFITILENLMTGIHFLYFPVEEFSENGATIVQRNSGGKKNVKKLGGGWVASPPFSHRIGSSSRWEM